MMTPAQSEPSQLLELSIDSVSSTLEKAVSAPPGSITGLIHTDDWSFIIKAHALIEGAVSMMLSGILDYRLKAIFEKLELGAVDTGKLEFSKALDLTTSQERRFIKKLSSIRNLLAHDMRHLGFSIDAFIESLDKQQRHSFYESLMTGANKENEETWHQFVKKSPKLAIFGNTLSIIAKAALTLQDAKTKQAMTALKLEYADKMAEFWSNPTIDIVRDAEPGNTAG